jgi:hypothetical protein
MIKLLDILKEIGEASKAFTTQRNEQGQSIVYTINDENFPIDNFTILITTGEKNDIINSQPNNVEKPRFALSKYKGNAARIDFGVIENDQWSFPVINRGYLFGIMGTVVNSIRQVIAANPGIEYLLFIPASKIKSTTNFTDNKRFKLEKNPPPQADTQVSDNGSQRENLYLAYVKKQLPNATLTKENGWNVIQIKK